MTTVANSITEKPAAGQGQGFLVQWLALANGNDGTPFDMTGFEPLSVQIEGTFGAAGSVSLEGSNDASNYEILHDLSTNALTFTAAGLKAVGDNTNFVKPKVTAGDGTTSLNVSLWVRKALRR
jgi:hypothetical protein